MVLMDVVPVDVPALFGLDVLDSESLYADNVTNRLVHRFVSSCSNDPLEYDDIWSVPIIRRDSHLYALMSFPESIFYTNAQLLKLHRNFAHPSAQKLYKLCERAGLEMVASETLERLKTIVASCEPYQRIRNARLRFRIFVGQENLKFYA